MTEHCGVWFLVNPRSGGGSGRLLFERLRRSFGTEAVFDLCDMDLKTTLSAAQAGGMRLAVCGGDGSIASVLDSIYVNNLHVAPGLVPLGTGNDLARVLGWMGIQTASPEGIVTAITDAQVRTFDRMYVSGPNLSRSWYNYCSFGSDAQIALYFDLIRKRHPRLFRHVWCNKAVYGLITLTQLAWQLRDRAPQLAHADPALAHAAALLFLNIPSYAGGLCLSPRINFTDGLIDQVVLPHLTALAALIPGRRALRVATQAATHRVELRHAVAMQCDGEAWMAQPGMYTIQCRGQVQLLARA